MSDTVITHMDADGVLSLATLMKRLGHSDLRSYFTSPASLLNIILKSILDRENSLGMLYIFDLAGDRESVIAASIYRKVKWIDHHEWESPSPENIEFYVDSSADSACRLVSGYFSVHGFEEIADEIDTNDVKTDESNRIRNIISYLRDKNRGKILSKALFEFAKDLAENGLGILYGDRYEIMMNEYREKLKEFEDLISGGLKIYNLDKISVATIESQRSFPVYHACNMLEHHTNAPFDVILAVFKFKNSTKIELRTQTGFDVHRVAKAFGGGGHRVASGAKVDCCVDKEDVLRIIDILANEQRGGN